MLLLDTDKELRNITKDLILLASTIGICLKIICSSHPNDVKANRNRLNSDPNCTKGRCQNCSGSDWFDDLKRNIALKKSDEKIISYF